MAPHSDWATAPPAPPLRAMIERYVGYRLSGFEPGLHRGLPSRYMTFIVSIGPAIDVIAQTDPHQPPASYRAVVSGLQARHAVIGYGDHQEGVAIELNPLGARMLFGVPSRELWDASVECADVVGRHGWDLWERLQGVPDWPARFAVCDEVLMRWTDHEAHMRRELRYAWHSLVRSGGTTTVSDVATAVGWSRQHLTRRFVDEFGLGPKLAARVVRFERATRMLRNTPSFTTIAQVAAACGYFDQSHLDRDFIELAGCTPSHLLAEQVPSVQDDPGPYA
ncbi:MAG: helix-turn-helix domain-containing protein [Acidimicrobiales bacterium]